MSKYLEHFREPLAPEIRIIITEPATAYAFGTRSASESLAMARPSTVERALRSATGLHIPANGSIQQ